MAPFPLPDMSAQWESALDTPALLDLNDASRRLHLLGYGRLQE